MGTMDPIGRQTFRAGVVKQFEITFELSWKLMARWLNTHVTEGITDRVSKSELFRLAAEKGLVADVEKWMEYNKARNQTAHIYDQRIADLVYRATREFVHDATYLLRALEARND